MTKFVSNSPSRLSKAVSEMIDYHYLQYKSSDDSQNNELTFSSFVDISQCIIDKLKIGAYKYVFVVDEVTDNIAHLNYVINDTDEYHGLNKQEYDIVVNFSSKSVRNEFTDVLILNIHHSSNN